LLQQFSLLQLASISATRSRYAAGTSAAILRTIICNRIPQQPLSNQQKLTPTTEARRRGENRKGKRELRRFTHPWKRSAARRGR